MSTISQKLRHGDRCVNPFMTNDADNHIGKNLRSITSSLLKKFPSLDPKSKICHSCRKRAYALNTSDLDVSDENLNTTNLSTEQSEGKRYQKTISREEELEEILNALKDKFSSLPYNDPDRMRILTIAPLSWSIRKIASKFGTTIHMAKKAKDLRSSKGILPKITSKVGQSLPDETVEKVKQFYVNDSNSRIMSGKKEVVSLKSDGKKTIEQKRLVLYNLKELHAKYKEENIDHPVGFSKFCQLRPKYCVLAGACGTHSVCVCVTHQNCKLMLDAINVAYLTKNLEEPIKDYKDCLKAIMCQKPKPECHLNNCVSCPGTDKLYNLFTRLLDEAEVTEVLFSVWESTDRATLRTDNFPVEDFMQELCEKLINLKTHHFIAKEQSSYLENLRTNLKNGEVLVQCDFSENYAFIVQNAAQAFHYNNDQCTVHPIVYYYRKESEVKHRSILILSDCLSHDTAAVYVSQKIIMQQIRKDCNVQKLIYFTDGAKQHYKNRFNMANLIHHEDDFGVRAEWHFHATAHGKGACDGVGAALKRGATRASLQASATHAILTPKALFTWAKKNLTNIKVYFYTKDEYEQVKQSLEKRFSIAKSIPNIQKSHSFIPTSDKQIVIKRFSNSATEVIFPKHDTKKRKTM